MKRVIHAPSGETALCRLINYTEDFAYLKEFVYLQFDRTDHPHSHGWHAYPVSEVRVIEEEE
jgi:hypothetical protein